MIYIFCAPSGSGKSTMVKHLLTMHPNLFELSVSCTTRPPRGEEQHGKEYYFITVEEFQKRIENDDFIEFEQVYEGLYYGTLKAEIDRIEAAGRQVLFDVDVKGGLKLNEVIVLNAFLKLLHRDEVVLLAVLFRTTRSTCRAGHRQLK